MRAADSNYLFCASIDGAITCDVVIEILSVPGFGAPYHDAETDALSVVNRISEDLQSLHSGKVVQKVEVIREGSTGIAVPRPSVSDLEPTFEYRWKKELPAQRL